jgi:hypothetical protein
VVTNWSAELGAGGRFGGLRASFPGLKGTYDLFQVWITFSITSDASQVRAGQSFGKPTITTVDYLNPYLQVYLYMPCPFSLRITAERKDAMTKITRFLRLDSKGLMTGLPQFDDRYFLDCLSGSNRQAEALFRRSAVRERLEMLGKFQLIRFEETYIKLVTSGDDPGDYSAEGIGTRLRNLSALGNEVRSLGE